MLRKVYEYKTINKITEYYGSQRELPYREKVYDYRLEFDALRNMPSSLYKRKFLCSGTDMTAAVDNTDRIQQLLSIHPDTDEVIGYFEYRIDYVDITEETPILLTQYDSTSNSYLSVPATDEQGNVLTTTTTKKIWRAIITEMMNFSDKYVAIFGFDLYNLLETCFTTPIPLEVYLTYTPEDERISNVTQDTTPSLDKVEWLVFANNPVMKHYDSVVQYLGGIIQLPEKQGQLKKYIVTKDNFLQRAYRRV